MEIWDAYTKDESLAGFDLIRGNEIPKGYYHLVCDVIIKHIDGDYLLMQRDLNKDTYPGYFTLTAGGSALKGENGLECITRELIEETGIEGKNIIKICKSICDNRQRIYYQYLCIVDIDKTSITLQEGETISYKWVNKKDLQKIVESDEFAPTLRDRLKRFFEIFNVGKEFNYIIDRPIGAVHPKHSDIIYPINYGYVPGLIAGDGEEQDVYILGIDYPLETFTGVVIAIIMRLNDVENKWVVAPIGKNYTDKEIIDIIHFQEQFYKSILLR